MQANEVVVLLSGFALLMTLVFFGVRVGIAIAAVALIGLWTQVGDLLIDQVGLTLWRSMNSYALTAVPLYVLMGEILLRGRFVEDAYRFFTVLLRRVPGGAAYGNIGASVVFASMSGSSVANAATIGTVAGPAMVKMGYSKRVTFGSIAAGGTLGILLPPSTVLIMYGGLTGESIGDLFMAGLIPGILGALLFAIVVFVSSSIWNRKHGRVGTPDLMEGTSLLTVVASTVAVLSLLSFVLGGIYLGWFSPTESAGVGVCGALILGVVFRRISIPSVWDGLGSTVSLTSSILFIVGAAGVLSLLVKYLGVTTSMAESLATSGLPVGAILALFALLYLVLGLFIESTSLIVLTVPVVYPVLSSLGVDGVWLGIFIVLLIEIGLITPPVGLNLFVLQRVNAGQTFMDVAMGSLPYAAALLGLAGAIYAVPELATWLPDRMR